MGEHTVADTIESNRLHKHTYSTGEMESKTVGVVGLGYVGLPLAIAFGQRFSTVGFDVSNKKIESYRSHIDPTGEISEEEFKLANKLRVTRDAAQLNSADVI